MEENYTEARKWYQKALSMGMNESEERLEGDKIREDESGKVPGTELYY